MTTAAAKRVEPSVHLYQNKPYTNAANTDLRSQWAEWFAEHQKPVTADSYQADAIAEAQARHGLGND